MIILAHCAACDADVYLPVSTARAQVHAYQNRNYCPGHAPKENEYEYQE
ncbi:hypothetical protein [Nesterenkonia pannonica]|nr:hypothetical protein [Nesterenkonia pannonica]